MRITGRLMRGWGRRKWCAIHQFARRWPDGVDPSVAFVEEADRLGIRWHWVVKLLNPSNLRQYEEALGPPRSAGGRDYGDKVEVLMRLLLEQDAPKQRVKYTSGGARMTPKTETERPTLEDVAVLETRLVDLDVEMNELGEREQKLTKQIASIHTGAGSKKDLPALMHSRSAAKEERSDVLDAHTALRSRIAEDLEVASTGAAAKRLKDINKAYGSSLRALKSDEAAAREAAAEYKAKVTQVNARFKTLALLRAEVGALADRFPGIPAGPGFPAVVVPAKRDPCIEAAFVVDSVRFHGHGRIATGMEKDADGFRSRRDYKEIDGTVGAAIIVAAGVRPWPALTEQQNAPQVGGEQLKRGDT